MTGLTITGLDSEPRHVGRAALADLAQQLSRPLLGPADDGYDETLRIWNGMVAKRPAVVIRPQNAREVVHAVGFARDHGLELSIKGGGHNIAGLALSDGGVTLDMSSLRSVDVDPTQRLARVGPGCTLGDVDRLTQEHGLAATFGFVSQTGVAGLTLGGGFGYLTRQYGWTVDDLEEVELVTADGDVVRASRRERPDLFWALRGGGGNFGVATEFVFRLHPVGPDVTAGLIAWSADDAPALLTHFRELTASAPRELTVAALMRNAPPAPWLPADRHGRPMIAFVVNHTGSAEAAEADLAPLRSYGEPWADLVQRKPYVDQQAMLDATQPKGMHYYWKSEFLPGLSEDLLATYRAQFENLDAPANQIVLFHIEGALSEHDADDGAVGNRDAAFACVVQSMSTPDSPTAAADRQWVTAAWQALRPYSTGGNYVNFQTADEGSDRIRESYGDQWPRLAEVKAKYDADNLFRVNRNILPV